MNATPFSLADYTELVLQKKTHIVQRQDGTDVTINSTEGEMEKWPIEGQMVDADGITHFQSWAANGRFWGINAYLDEYDLFIVPAPVQPVLMGYLLAHYNETTREPHGVFHAHLPELEAMVPRHLWIQEPTPVYQPSSQS